MLENVHVSESLYEEHEGRCLVGTVESSLLDVALALIPERNVVHTNDTRQSVG